MSVKIFKREINVRVHHFLPKVTITRRSEVQSQAAYAETAYHPETMSREMHGFGGFMR